MFKSKKPPSEQFFGLFVFVSNIYIKPKAVLVWEFYFRFIIFPAASSHFKLLPKLTFLHIIHGVLMSLVSDYDSSYNKPVLVLGWGRLALSVYSDLNCGV